jgi:hydroxylamine oxidation protein HaoB
MNDSSQAVVAPEYNHYLRISVWVGLLLAIIIAGFIYFVDKNRLSITPSSSDSVDALQRQEMEVDNKPTLFKSEPVSIEEPLTSFFTIDDIKRYTIFITGDMSYELTVAGYMGSETEQRQAVIYLPAEKDDEGNVVDKQKIPVQFRYEKWLSASHAINTYTNNDSLFVSFWDNAQRVHLFTGRENWLRLPAKDAYMEDEYGLWQAVAGGFDRQGRSAKFSELLITDVDEALRELKKELPQGRDHYLLLSTDDLSHVQEIARMTGRGLPLETRLFPADADLHDRISQVKEWAQEGEGTGSYLAQSVSERSIRVWRITDESFENTLLARLLPFSTSLDASIEGAKLVYQSDWGGYISIYQLLD